MRLIYSASQFDKLADICIGLGHLVFGSTAIPFIIASVDKPPLMVLACGLGFTIGLWIFSLYIVKGNNK